MTGLAQTGAQTQLNALTKASLPVVAASAPTWVPGLYWINTSSGNSVNEWNGAAWVVAQATGFLALLTADPTGQTTISGLQEVTTSGYARQPVTFNPATTAYPSQATNSGLIVFGPFTANMTIATQWLALVTVLTGNVGFLLNTWTLQSPQQVLATQSIDVAAGSLILNQS